MKKKWLQVLCISLLVILFVTVIVTSILITNKKNAAKDIPDLPDAVVVQLED